MSLSVFVFTPLAKLLINSSTLSTLTAERERQTERGEEGGMKRADYYFHQTPWERQREWAQQSEEHSVKASAESRGFRICSNQIVCAVEGVYSWCLLRQHKERMKMKKQMYQRGKKQPMNLHDLTKQQPPGLRNETSFFCSSHNAPLEAGSKSESIPIDSHVKMTNFTNTYTSLILGFTSFTFTSTLPGIHFHPFTFSLVLPVMHNWGCAALNDMPTGYSDWFARAEEEQL